VVSPEHFPSVFRLVFKVPSATLAALHASFRILSERHFQQLSLRPLIVVVDGLVLFARSSVVPPSLLRVVTHDVKNYLASINRGVARV
jgi:hypothetical protein